MLISMAKGSIFYLNETDIHHYILYTIGAFRYGPKYIQSPDP
jgi:hypothetical protein